MVFIIRLVHDLFMPCCIVYNSPGALLKVGSFILHVLSVDPSDGLGSSILILYVVELVRLCTYLVLTDPRKKRKGYAPIDLSQAKLGVPLDIDSMQNNLLW
jgi:hypothetical protein